MAFTQVIKTLGSVMASMKTAVDTWLSTNITNPSNPPLDRSLSLANACAPADMVGDIKNEIGNLYTLEYNQGAYIDNNGSVYLHTTGTSAGYKATRLDITGYEQITVNTYCGTTKPMLITDESGNILSSVATSTTNFNILSSTVVNLPTGAKYIYINCNGGENYNVTIDGITVRGEIDKAVDIINEKIESITNKSFNKVSGLGDSITAGYCPSGNVTDTYQKLIADTLGAEYQKLGVVSSPICPNSDLSSDQNNNAFVYRYTQIANDADLIIIAGGTNDFRHNVPLGSETDTATNFEYSFYGAVDYLLQNIITNHVYAKIVFITPFHQWQDTVSNSAGYKLTDYINAIKTVCKRYGITVIDGYKNSGINKVNAFASVMFPDYIHPTKEGHLLIYKNLMPYFSMK